MPIGNKPEKALIAAVRFDVVDSISGRYSLGFGVQAMDTKRIYTKEFKRGLFPAVCTIKIPVPIFGTYPGISIDCFGTGFSCIRARFKV